MESAKDGFLSLPKKKRQQSTADTSTDADLEAEVLLNPTVQKGMQVKTESASLTKQDIQTIKNRWILMNRNLSQNSMYALSFNATHMGLISKAIVTYGMNNVLKVIDFLEQNFKSLKTSRFKTYKDPLPSINYFFSLNVFQALYEMVLTNHNPNQQSGNWNEACETADDLTNKTLIEKIQRCKRLNTESFNLSKFVTSLNSQSLADLNIVIDLLSGSSEVLQEDIDFVNNIRKKFKEKYNIDFPELNINATLETSDLEYMNRKSFKFFAAVGSCSTAQHIKLVQKFKSIYTKASLTDTDRKELQNIISELPESVTLHMPQVIL